MIHGFRCNVRTIKLIDAAAALSLVLEAVQESERCGIDLRGGADDEVLGQRCGARIKKKIQKLREVLIEDRIVVLDEAT